MPRPTSRRPGSEYSQAARAAPGDVHRLLPVDRRDGVLARIHDLIGEFERIAGGMRMLGERPPRSVDEAVAIGERLSALLMAAYLESQGTPAVAVNAPGGGRDGRRLRQRLAADGADAGKGPRALAAASRERVLPVITGFNGATADGRPTTLGRGGSDFSASILSAALDAAELWIWTDVDGILSADPRLVPDAKVLDEVTYSERRNSPIRARRCCIRERWRRWWRRRSRSGAKTASRRRSRGRRSYLRSRRTNGARAVTSMAKVALVALEPASAELNGAHVMARALDAIARVNVEVLALSSSSYRQSFCFLVRSEELERTRQALESALSLELAHGYLRPIQVDERWGCWRWWRRHAGKARVWRAAFSRRFRGNR